MSIGPAVEANARVATSATGDRTRVLVVGGSSPMAQALTRDLISDGAEVTMSGRHRTRVLDEIPHDLRERVQTVTLDLAHEPSIAAARALGPLDYVVSLAAANANGPVQTLARSGVVAALDAKVIGPMLLAKHLADLIRPGGGFIFFSGVAARKPAYGVSVSAITNGAVGYLVEALAVELAPTRVVAISPGIINPAAGAAMGDGHRTAIFDGAAKTNPVGRVGTIADVVQTVRFAMANTFLTGTTLHVDGGGHLL